MLNKIKDRIYNIDTEKCLAMKSFKPAWEKKCIEYHYKDRYFTTGTNGGHVSFDKSSNWSAFVELDPRKYALGMEQSQLYFRNFRNMAEQMPLICTQQLVHILE